MDCHDFEKLLCEYNAEELGPETVQIVETHLKTCPLCGEKLSVIRQAEKAVRSLTLMPLPEKFSDSIMEKINAKEGENAGPAWNVSWLSCFFRPEFAMVGVCGLIICLVLFFGHTNSSQEQTRISPEEPPFFSLAQTSNLLPEDFQSPERSGCQLVCNSPQEDSPFLSEKNSQKVFRFFSSQ